MHKQALPSSPKHFGTFDAGVLLEDNGLFPFLSLKLNETNVLIIFASTHPAIALQNVCECFLFQITNSHVPPPEDVYQKEFSHMLNRQPRRSREKINT